MAQEFDVVIELKGPFIKRYSIRFLDMPFFGKIYHFFFYRMPNPVIKIKCFVEKSADPKPLSELAQNLYDKGMQVPLM